MLSVIFLILSILSGAYFVLINIASPGTFLGTIFSFSAVWLLIAVFFALLFVLERQKILKKILLGISKTSKIILVSYLHRSFYCGSESVFYLHSAAF